MTNEETQEVRREYAEKIIAGEYSAVVIALIGEGEKDHKIDCYFDGSACTALGLVEILRDEIKDAMKE